jgi:hypothetical protein
MHGANINIISILSFKFGGQQHDEILIALGRLRFGENLYFNAGED